MKPNALVVGLLLLSLGCTPQQSNQLTQQEKDQITKEVAAVADSIIAKAEKLDVGFLDHYADSPEWGMVNADGSRWDYPTTLKMVPDLFKSMTAWKWTTTRQDFTFVSRDMVICAWDGKDETTLKLGDKIIYDPHAYTMIFRKIAGQWKAVYSHDSGLPVTQKAGKK